MVFSLSLAAVARQSTRLLIRVRSASIMQPDHAARAGSNRAAGHNNASKEITDMADTAELSDIHEIQQVLLLYPVALDSRALELLE